MHCVAGDGVGILAAAILSSFFVLDRSGRNRSIFQAPFMRDMAGGSYRRALGGTFVSGTPVDEPIDGGNGGDGDGLKSFITAAADPTLPTDTAQATREAAAGWLLPEPDRPGLGFEHHRHAVRGGVAPDPVIQEIWPRRALPRRGPTRRHKAG